MRSGYRFLVSTDVAGPFATPLRWKLLWGEALKYSQFAGFEMLAWGWPRPFWIRSLLGQAKKLGLNVAGIHGRVGYKKRYENLQEILAFVQYNEFFLPTAALMQNFNREMPYVLFHALELMTEKNFQAVAKAMQNAGIVMVENGEPKNEGIEKVLQLATNLKKAGVKSGATFDLFHHFAIFPDMRFKDKWQKELVDLENFLRRAEKLGLPVNIHLPLGERKIDSFSDELGVPELKELAAVIKNRIWYLVIEDQPNNDALLLPGQKATVRLITHNRRILEKLSQSGLIL
jgi:hypothetical protein